MPGDPDARDALVERLFMANIEAMEVFSVYLGDRLGLYRALAAGGPMTVAEVAAGTGVDARYAREWLEQQAVAGFLEVDADLPEDERRFTLPEAYVEVLTDPDSLYSMAPMCRSIAALGGALPLLVEAYPTGDGVAWDGFGNDMIEAQGDFNRPWLRASLGTEYLPSIPDVHERLSAGARVADVACGVGWAAIAIAQAYPDVRVDGFDLDELSIELATEKARAAGVDDRVTFTAGDAAATAAGDGGYDLAIVVEAIHDMSHPVEVLSSIRSILAPGGTLIVADERTEDRFVAPASETERLFYGYSILTCLPSGLLDKPSAGTGTVMRRATFERYADEAGFAAVAELPIEHDFLRFYRLDP
jgi:2-polyprenyl-3-methyl-5-hydroxy-6-metoxy-1,4-benzoquinol methylase